jgi:hypothetical protein
MEKQNENLDVKSAVDLLLPLEAEEKVTPESGVAEPEEAQVSEAEEQEEAIQETEEVETDESDEVEDTTSQEDEVEEVEEETQELYTIKVDGEEEQVTLDQALSGHMREKKFHRELNKLSNERKSFEAVKATADLICDFVIDLALAVGTHFGYPLLLPFAFFLPHFSKPPPFFGADISTHFSFLNHLVSPPFGLAMTNPSLSCIYHLLFYIL